MDLGNALTEMRRQLQAEFEKVKPSDRRLIGFADMGSRVARLIKLHPSTSTIDEGHIDPEVMDGDGGMPLLEIFRDGKRSFDIKGRKDLEALAALLIENGYGKR